MAVQLLRHTFTVEEYHRMAAAGILGEDDRVELLDGEILEMTPIGSRHAACVDRLTYLFVRGVGQRAIVRVQNPVRLTERSEPQPDLALLRPRPDFYAADHPGPTDLLLLVEVADTSVELDREVKVPLYARTGVSEVWIVDLVGECVEVYRSPGAQGYAGTARFRRGQHVTPQAIPDLEIPVEDLLV